MGLRAALCSAIYRLPLGRYLGRAEVASIPLRRKMRTAFFARATTPTEEPPSFPLRSVHDYLVQPVEQGPPTSNSFCHLAIKK